MKAVTLHKGLLTRVNSRLAQREHVSENRRRYLQKLARLICDERPKVLFADIKTASCQYDPEFIIKITSNANEQPVTNLPANVYRLLEQETFLFHEVAHVKYTDAEARNWLLESVPLSERKGLHVIYNAAEDCAIEEQLRREMDVSRELDTLRANSHARMWSDIRKAPILSLLNATMVTILELGAYDSGNLDDIKQYIRTVSQRDMYDNLRPHIEELVANVVSEPNPRARYEHILDFWELFKEITDESEVKSDPTDYGMGGFDEDGNPEKAGGDTPGEDAEELGDISAEVVLQEIRGEEDDEEEEGQEMSGGTGQMDSSPQSDDGDGEPSDEDGDDEEGEGLSDRQNPIDESEEFEQVQERAEQKLDEIDNTAEQQNGTEEALEDYAKSAGDGNLDDMDVIVGEKPRTYSDRWYMAKRDGRRLSKVFQDKLRQKRKTKVHHERREGRFDSRRLISADRGSPYVFKQDDDGKEVEYEAYFILDRSTSMTGNDMYMAEDAVLRLMVALEEAGVKTELLDFYSTTPRLVKTLTQSVEDEEGNILGWGTSGLTPLGQTLQLLSGRLEGRYGQPFVVCVTDGRPGNEVRYKNALAEIDAPILGVFIGGSGSIDDATLNELYDSWVVVNTDDGITEGIRSLAMEVMF